MKITQGVSITYVTSGATNFSLFYILESFSLQLLYRTTLQMFSFIPFQKHY